MAKNDNRDKPRQPPARGPANPHHSSDAIPMTTDEWNDEAVQAEVKSSEAETRARIKAQSDTQAEAEGLKEGFFEKVVHKVKDALHIDTPDHMRHASAPLPPEDEARVREAHKVDLGEDGANLKNLPINKVPGKLRKFISK